MSPPPTVQPDTIILLPGSGAEIGGGQNAPEAEVTDSVGADTLVPDRDDNLGASIMDTEAEKTKTPDQPEQLQRVEQRQK